MKPIQLLYFDKLAWETIPRKEIEPRIDTYSQRTYPERTALELRGGTWTDMGMALCANMTETNTSSFITVEGEEDMDVKSHGKQWESEPGGQ